MTDAMTRNGFYRPLTEPVDSVRCLKCGHPVKIDLYGEMTSHGVLTDEGQYAESARIDMIRNCDIASATCTNPDCQEHYSSEWEIMECGNRGKLGYLIIDVFQDGTHRCHLRSGSIYEFDKDGRLVIYTSYKFREGFVDDDLLD